MSTNEYKDPHINERDMKLKVNIKITVNSRMKWVQRVTMQRRQGNRNCLCLNKKNMKKETRECEELSSQMPSPEEGKSKYQCGLAKATTKAKTVLVQSLPPSMKGRKAVMWKLYSTVQIEASPHPIKNKLIYGKARWTHRGYSCGPHWSSQVVLR